VGKSNTASIFSFRFRHYLILFAFLVLCALPTLYCLYYLNFRAKDQYAATVAFSVRTEDVSSAIDLIGGLSALGSGSSSDSDVLYEYIKSKTLVDEVDKKFDLRNLYSEHYDLDPIFSFKPGGSIEDLVEYWPWVVKVFYDQGTGLIEVQVRAFSPIDARDIAKAIFDESSAMINELSDIAREDTIGNARDELQRALTRVKDIRKEIMRFRSENKMIDPLSELEMQAGVVNALNNQLSELLIEYDVIAVSSDLEDPRLIEIMQRISIVRERIAGERKKFVVGDDYQSSYSKLVSEFEGLVVQREYAENTYVAALAAYDAALTEAERQSRYLAAYIKPTLAEKSEHPDKIIITFFVMFFSMFVWASFVLVYYAVRDRR
jgi:capsular polysaccharide transport system permease protein